jgi:hypothetical protein
LSEGFESVINDNDITPEEKFFHIDVLGGL